MPSRTGNVVPLVAALLCALALLAGAGMLRAHGGAPEVQSGSLAKITVDYPLEGSIFPPDITPPTFLWRDANESAKRWVISVSFGWPRKRHSP